MSSHSTSNSRIVVAPLTPAALARLEGASVAFPVHAYAGWLHRPRRKPVLIAYGGLAWRVADRETGRRWCEIWFEIAQPKLVRTLTLVRWARRMLGTAKQLGEPAVFCMRSEDRPQSDKLLELVGLTLDPDMSVEGSAEMTGEVWLWRP